MELPLMEVLAGGLVVSSLIGAVLAVTDRRRSSALPGLPATGDAKADATSETQVRKAA